MNILNHASMLINTASAVRVISLSGTILQSGLNSLHLPLYYLKPTIRFFIMPIYEYQCQACENVSDFLQKMSDDPMLTCPECDEDALKKLVSAPRFRLAGSGWYETDFKQGDKKNLASSETNDAKSTVKAESKAEVKASETESKSKTNTSSKGDGKAA